MTQDFVQRGDGTSNTIMIAENVNAGYWADIARVHANGHHVADTARPADRLHRFRRERRRDARRGRVRHRAALYTVNHDPADGVVQYHDTPPAANTELQTPNSATPAVIYALTDGSRASMTRPPTRTCCRPLTGGRRVPPPTIRASFASASLTAMRRHCRRIWTPASTCGPSRPPARFTASRRTAT